MSQTRDPNSTYCRRCGAELVWEHPKGSGHYQMSSDYVGGDICRSCLEEQRSMPTGAAEVMDEDVTKIPVTLYQAPFAVLSERGLLLKMHDHNRPYAGPVPSQYYMPVFHGNLEFRGPLPQDPIARRASILENFFALYNRDDRPNPKTSRSMSVGSTLEVSVFPNDDFPCINIDLLQKDGISERVCFVEHNPEKAPGHQLHIGVYCSTEEDTVYYDSYVRTEEKVYVV